MEVAEARLDGFGLVGVLKMLGGREGRAAGPRAEADASEVDEEGCTEDERPGAILAVFSLLYSLYLAAKHETALVRRRATRGWFIELLTNLRVRLDVCFGRVLAAMRGAEGILPRLEFGFERRQDE